MLCIAFLFYRMQASSSSLLHLPWFSQRSGVKQLTQINEIYSPVHLFAVLLPLLPLWWKLPIDTSPPAALPPLLLDLYYCTNAINSKFERKAAPVAIPGD